jgi:hypothetical protein
MAYGIDEFLLCQRSLRLALPHQTVAQVVHWLMEKTVTHSQAHVCHFPHNHYTELAPLIHNTHKPSAICYAANLDNNN